MPDDSPADSGDAVAGRGRVRDQVERALREKFRFGREYAGEVRQRAHYNIACALALRGGAAADGSDDRTRLATEAFEHLDRAVAAGWGDWRHLQHDQDLGALHADPRWAKLVEGCRARAKQSSERRRGDRDDDD